MTDKVIEIPGWRVTESLIAPLYRGYRAEPAADTDLLGKYTSFTQEGKRRGEVVYPCRLLGLNFSWVWKDDSWERGISSPRIALLKPKSLERYQSGWRAESFYIWWNNMDEEIQKAIEEMTLHFHPHTKVTITEEPA